MVKTCKLVVCGASGVGKTTILENAIYGEFCSKEKWNTKEDCYLAQIETDRGVREQVRVQDTSGAEWTNPSNSSKHYFNFGEGFLLVYSITDKESFRCIEAIKREIERTREKKEVVIVVVGNKTDLNSQKQVDATAVRKWAAKEKVKVFNTTVNNRASLVEPFIYICSKLTQPPQKSTLLGSRRLKQASVD